MEEAWELAVIVMSSSSPRNYKETIDQLSIEFRNDYSSEFSDKFDKTKNKLIYAAVLSITVGLYDLSSDSSFLGFKLGGLTDYRLEWMLWLASMFFFLNMIFRYFDERRAFEKYTSEVNSLKNVFSTLLAQMDGISSYISERLEGDQGFSAALDELDKRLMKTSSALDNFLGAEDAQKAVLDFQMSFDKIRNDISDVETTNTQAAHAIKEMPDLMRRFEKKNKLVKSYKNIGGFRFVVFDFVLPCLLFGLATTIHFSPGVSKVMLDLTSTEVVEIFPMENQS